MSLAYFGSILKRGKRMEEEMRDSGAGCSPNPFQSALHLRFSCFQSNRFILSIDRNLEYLGNLILGANSVDQVLWVTVEYLLLAPDSWLLKCPPNGR